MKKALLKDSSDNFRGVSDFAEASCTRYTYCKARDKKKRIIKKIHGTSLCLSVSVFLSRGGNFKSLTKSRWKYRSLLSEPDDLWEYSQSRRQTCIFKKYERGVLVSRVWLWFSMSECCCCNFFFSFFLLMNTWVCVCVFVRVWEYEVREKSFSVSLFTLFSLSALLRTSHGPLVRLMCIVLSTCHSEPSQLMENTTILRMTIPSVSFYL